MRYDLFMIETCIKDILRFTPTNFVEIGSRDGHDTNTLSKSLKINPSNCYILEAHPNCYEYIQQTYPQYNILHCAVTDKTGPINFNAGTVGIEDNIGCSSLLEDVSNKFCSNKVIVDGWRFDNICQHIGLNEIDIIKIDVEGHTYEVLNGFGNIINRTKILQLELEHKENWTNQKLYSDVSLFLKQSNFEQLYYIKHSHDQSDSLWINKNYFNI
jgi:FkbM family methyltransferase